MSALRLVAARVKGLFGRARCDRDLDEEFAAHLQLEMDENLRRGMAPDEARRQALAASGGIERAKEAYRDQRGLPWIEAIGRELAGAIARLRRRPATFVATAGSLALGMALATAVFSMVDALFLRPLPYPHQEQLVRLYQRDPLYKSTTAWMPARDLLAAMDHGGSSIAGVAGARNRGPAAVGIPGSAVVGASGTAERAQFADVTPNYFAVLGVRPLLGRPFTDADATGSEPAVILAHQIWMARFGGDSAIVGTSTLVNGHSARIVGVMPADFDMPPGTGVWRPLGHDELVRIAALGPKDAPQFMAIARLKAGTSLRRADAELSSAYRGADAGLAIGRVPQSALTPLADEVTGQYKTLVELWVAAAIVIILLCAVNFATLTVARGMRRREELGVRLALGATRRRIVGMMMSETVVTAALAAVLAAVIAAWMLATRHLLFGGDLLPVAPVLDWRTLTFGLVGTVIVGMAFGLAPAVDLSRGDLGAVLSGSARITSGSRELRSRRGLVALQLGLSLACMAVLGALVAAEGDQQGVGPGYDYSHVVTAQLYVPDSLARVSGTASLVEALRAIPGVREAAVVRSPDDVGATLIYRDRHPRDYPYFAVNWRDVSARYFNVLGLTPLMGRLPTADEVVARAPVMVLSKSTARCAFYGDSSPIGRKLGVPVIDKQHLTWFTVIGVVPDVRTRFDPYSAPVYTFQSLPLGVSSTALVLRMASDPRLHLQAVKEAVGQADPRLMVSDVEPVSTQVATWLAPARAVTLFFGFIGLIALVLAVVGVYGLTSYAAEVRAREFGIRSALGASRARLARTLIADLGGVTIGAVLGGLLLGERAIFLVDHVLPHPVLQPPLLSLQIIPALAATATLVLIVAVGTAVPMRRLMKQDVVRAILGGS